MAKFKPTLIGENDEFSVKVRDVADKIKVTLAGCPEGGGTSGLIPQEKSVTPNDTEQTVLADAGRYLSKVMVRAIPKERYARISYDGSGITVY